ncbi:MAG: MBL fold metallo-hydrolase [Anaerolineae bacterium]
MLLERIESKGLAHYSYLVGDGGEAVVIDPRRDCEIYVERAHRHGVRITHVLETHRNEDYLIGSLELTARTGAQVWHADAELDYAYPTAVEDGQEWRVGSLRLRAMLTPGHTLGLMSYVLSTADGEPWMLFCGDLLFAGALGRTDLLGEERLVEMTGLLYDSIYGKALPLGDQVILCPAHGSGSVCGANIADRPWTTIGLERRLNPDLRLGSRAEFVARVAVMHERPPYFRQMERLNVAGPQPLGPLPSPVPLGAHEFQRRAAGATVLDTRGELAFGGGHLPGAISIWQNGVPSFAGWFLDYGEPLLLVTDTDDTEEVMRYLVRIGFDDVAGFLAGDMHAWHAAGLDSQTSGIVTISALCRMLDAGEPMHILDVRGADELARGEIPGAQHIHITQLPQHLDEVPTDRRVYVFCGTGLRSTIAASLLQRAGHADVAVVQGGFRGWSSVRCPIRRRQAPQREEATSPV